MLTKASFATLMNIHNMDRAIKFYTKTLGGKVQMRAPGKMKNMWASVKVGREEFWLISTPGQPKRPELAFSTFIVKDIKGEVESLKKKGVRFQPGESMNGGRVEGPISYDDYGASAFFKDSEGNLLMLYMMSM